MGKEIRAFAVCVGILALVFSSPLLRVAALGLRNDLYSHILLMPFVSMYLVWIHRTAVSSRAMQGSPALALVCAALGGGLLLVPGFGQGRWQLESAAEDTLFFWVSGFVCLILAAGFWFLGRKAMKIVGLPVGLLFFMAPFPQALERGIEVFFQHASAEAAAIFFRVSGIAFVRQDLVFDLPTITLEVAPECSGIRSSLVLFITSLVAGYLFLQTSWKRAVLTLAVIPLGILRNGVRIFVIGWLCVRINPEMIHSWVHRQGGPMFFVLSLVPFFGLLLLLRRSEGSEVSLAAGSGPHEAK